MRFKSLKLTLNLRWHQTTYLHMPQYITLEWGFLQLAHLDGTVESTPLLDHHGTVFGVGPMTEHLSMRI